MSRKESQSHSVESEGSALCEDFWSSRRELLPFTKDDLRKIRGRNLPVRFMYVTYSLPKCLVSCSSSAVVRKTSKTITIPPVIPMNQFAVTSVLATMLMAAPT